MGLSSAYQAPMTRLQSDSGIPPVVILVTMTQVVTGEAGMAAEATMAEADISCRWPGIK